MSVIFLTLDNIDSQKQHLRQDFQQIKSTHLTEALAYGLGFRTHASILTAIRSASQKRPLLSTFDPERFSARLIELGYERTGLKKPENIDSLPDRMWIEFNQGDVAANNRWFHHCNHMGIPFVYIERRRKYVRLNWDCITLDRADETHVMSDNATKLVRAMYDKFCLLAKSEPGKPMFEGSAFVGDIDNLIPETAHEIADNFFTMLYEPMLKSKAMSQEH